MRKRIFIIVIFSAFIIEGCYHYRVVVPESDPATDYESATMHSLFWGLVNNPPKQVAGDCIGNALDEVRVSTNLGYSLISVVTLGIWTPLDVQWRCSKPVNINPDEEL